MADRTLTQDAALDLLQAGARVLLPTSTAASALRSAFNRRQMASGKAVWQQPDILSWSQWLSTLWTSLTLDGHEDRLLLNAAQELFVWRQIVVDDPASTPLTPADSLAALAKSSFALAAAFRASHRPRASANTHDARTFAAWADLFRRQCDRSRWLPAALLETAFVEHLAAGTLAAPSELWLLGFPEATPAQATLLEALRTAGTAVTSADLVASSASEPVRATTILPDPAAELRFAAAYARDFLQANPGASFAFLLPDLPAEAAAFESILRETLAPHLNNISADPELAPWSSTATPPLSAHASVGPFLDLAAWLRTSLPIDRISALLLSPFLGDPAARNDRVRFDAFVLRRQLLLRPELDLRSTLSLARQHDAPGSLVDLLQNLAEMSDQLATQPPRRTFAAWTDWLRQLRKTAVWAAPDFQPSAVAVMDAFDAVLDLVATLDFAGRRVTLAEALEAVATQARSAATPRPVPEETIWLLRPAEAQGLTFDAAIFLRATDAHLPAPARTDPLLDWQLQRQFNMSGADPAVDSSRAEAAFSQLVQSTPLLLLTRAAADESGHIRSSTFASTFSLELFETRPLLSGPLLTFDEVRDADGLPALPSTDLSGGARLLQLQAACGFLAFAEFRLGGRELDSPEPGFDAMESGNILHRALEHFWNEVRTQTALRAMPTSDRSAAISRAIDQAVSRRLRLHDSWDQAYLSVQKERMHSLLMRWLEFELAREPFEVLANETKQPVDIGPLHLSLRIDRIDRLPDGGVVFVDYKTGAAAKPSAWAGDRPDEPQLPLYSLVGEREEVRALTFAKLRAGEEMQYSGYATEMGILPKKGSKVVDLAFEIDAWKIALESLAQDFHSGVTTVSPKSYAVNCKRCSQRLLCRLDLTKLLGSAREGEDG